MAGAAESKYRQILGVRFFTGSAAEAVQIGLGGGLVVMPSAPALVELETDPEYRDALLHADLVLTDSGFMVLLWNLIKGEKITRTSGLEYLKRLVCEPVFRKAESALWIMPTERARDKNVTWLNSRGLNVTNERCFLSPAYDPNNVFDSKLLALLDKHRPAQIVIALGGGIQEKLGRYIRQNAAYKPAIHCVGAAIGFLSGDQVNIPAWADYFFLGWFLRCLSQPRKFIPRYWKAFRLLPMLIRYREKLPVLGKC